MVMEGIPSECCSLGKGGREGMGIALPRTQKHVRRYKGKRSCAVFLKPREEIFEKKWAMELNVTKSIKMVKNEKNLWIC